MLRVGVDTGGTFTDLVLLDESRLVVHKVRSTPDDPSRAILEGIDELSPATATGKSAGRGSTSFTARPSRPTRCSNGRARGSRLITTAGFEDVLRIGRQTRRELYNFLVRGPPAAGRPGA